MTSTSRRYFLSASFCALMLCVLSSPLAAQSSVDLIKYAPGGSGVVAGLDVKGSRGSALFKQALKFAGQNRKFKKAVTQLNEKAGFTFERDVDTLLFLAPSPKGAKAAKSTPYTLVLNGNFNTKKMAQAMAKEGVKDMGKGKHFLLSKRTELYLASESLLILTYGSKSYRKKAMAQAKAPKKTGLSSSMQRKLKRLDTSKHLWLALNSNRIKSGNQGDVSEVLLEGDLSAGVDLKGSMLFKDEANAQKLMDSYTKNKTKVSISTAMIGAPSLGSNMKLSRAGKTLSFQTKMPEKEVQASTQWLENYMKGLKAKRAKAKRDAKKAEKQEAPAQ